MDGVTVANEMLEAALEYARLGYRVFPVEGKSKQLLKSWKKEATADEATIRRWWKHWPTANVAIAPGRDCCVLDVDVKKDDGVATLKRSYGLDVEALAQTTPTGRTPSGGWHLYCDSPAGVALKNSVKALGPGLDVRTVGGYVVAPPSVIDGKVYEWVMPLTTPRAPWPKELLGVAEGEGRNDALTKQVGLWFFEGKGEDEVLSLARAWNAEHFDPPLDEGEVETIFNSIAERHRKVVDQRATEALTIRGHDGRLFDIGPLVVVGYHQPLYRLTVGGKLVTLKDTQQLVTLRSFQVAAFEQAGLVVDPRRDDWMKLLQQLRDRAVQEETREDEEGEVAEIREYLFEFFDTRLRVRGDTREARLENLINPGWAVLDGERVVFTLAAFRQWLGQRHHVKVARKELTEALQLIGVKKAKDRPHLLRCRPNLWEFPEDQINAQKEPNSPVPLPPTFY